VTSRPTVLSGASSAPDAHTTESKRKLIEVALPLEAINQAAVRENYIYRGNPSAIHKWWAQRALAVCRAVLFGSIVDDPSSRPDRFPSPEAQQHERHRLFRIVEQLVAWESANDPRLLDAVVDEMRPFIGAERPVVYDPFCGGGSIPLEAQRLGLDALAGDVNPVAALITKSLIELPQQFAGRPYVHPSQHQGDLLPSSGSEVEGLVEDVKYYGAWIRAEAATRLGRFYPNVQTVRSRSVSASTTIAWLWARTVRSPNPAWDGHVPLLRTFTLSSKKGRSYHAHPILDRASRRIQFEVRPGVSEVPGTVARTGAVCLATGTAIPFEYVRAEAMAGRMGTQLLAIVVQTSDGRAYMPPDEEHESIARRIEAPVGVLETELPAKALGFRVQAYGITRHRDLYTPRQLLALTTLSDLVGEARARLITDGADEAYANAVCTYLAFAVDKCAEYNCSLVPWYPKEDRPKGVFARQALPMVWDFAEVNPLGDIGGSFAASVGIVAGALEGVHLRGRGEVRMQSATRSDVVAPVLVSTDPPYYDNIGYSDLSDFFYVWLRRSLGAIYPEYFATVLVPKAEELVANPFRHDGDRRAAERSFEAGLKTVFGRLREVHDQRFPMTIYYAYKQAEEGAGEAGAVSTGWETILGAMLSCGLQITGTWPVRTERTGRSVAMGTAALASAIVLVCRSRPQGANLATRRQFIDTLRAELPNSLRALQDGNIAPVDLAQASIGPGMSIFSQYGKVIEADGASMTVRTALGLINQVLDETLSEQDADFDASTRWAVAWFEQFGMEPGDFGVAEILSKAKNSAVNALVEAGIVENRASKVRLLGRDQLAADWDPATDVRLTVWGVTQNLIRALESGGEPAAAQLVGRIGGLAETARELAYRLYNISERNRWAKEAFSYNGLVVAWPAILRLGAEQSGQAVQLSLGS
jgi:putative DNA methylase